MVSPSPIVRPVIGDWPVDGLLDDLPVRPPPATEKLRKIVDFYLHSMVFHKDRLGRPVRARVRIRWCIYRRLRPLDRGCENAVLTQNETAHTS